VSLPWAFASLQGKEGAVEGDVHGKSGRAYQIREKKSVPKRRSQESNVDIVSVDGVANLLQRWLFGSQPGEGQ
jgi:hypothetical protein